MMPVAEVATEGGILVFFLLPLAMVEVEGCFLSSRGGGQVLVSVCFV
jgi:hypothetical protein